MGLIVDEFSLSDRTIWNQNDAMLSHGFRDTVIHQWID
jgi:hypothetical protein